jgi:hypothetical protein
LLRRENNIQESARAYNQFWAETFLLMAGQIQGMWKYEASVSIKLAAQGGSMSWLADQMLSDSPG